MEPEEAATGEADTATTVDADDAAVAALWEDPDFECLRLVLPESDLEVEGPEVPDDDTGGNMGRTRGGGGGDVGGRGQNKSRTRSISVFQCGWQSVYSSGMQWSFFSIILPRLHQDSKNGPSQNVHRWAVLR
jgi:hypothetical protein